METGNPTLVDGKADSWPEEYEKHSQSGAPWVEPTERDLNGQSRIPEKDRNLERILKANPNSTQMSFREAQIRTTFRESWWDDCINKVQLYVAFTTFGPDKEKYHMFYPEPAIKFWVSGEHPKYLVQYMENVVKPKNPYVANLRYAIKTTTGIIKLPVLTSGSSISDGVNRNLAEYLEKHLGDQLEDFTSVETAKQRAMSEMGRKKAAIAAFNKDLQKHRNTILDNVEHHKKWFFENIPEAKPRDVLEWAQIDVNDNYRGFEAEKFVPKMTTLTYPQIKEYLRREEITDPSKPDNVRFIYRRRKLPDGRDLLVRITQHKKSQVES